MRCTETFRNLRVTFLFGQERKGVTEREKARVRERMKKKMCAREHANSE